MNNKELKKGIRKKVISYLKETDKYLAEIELLKTLFNSTEWQNAESIGVTLSMDHEVSTENIIRFALIENKKVYVPNCDYQNKTMDFVRFHSPADLHKDEKGILAVENPTEVNNEVDLLLVPGLGFNTDGYRVGYGGGYYDRFLSSFNGRTVSVILDAQIMDIPIDDFDQPVHQIITEKRTFTGVRR
ncbi:5-formyltetrahydrofolate cyclo-ligase [Macrococcus brunensis]|uniref:5-formyltetrahydrofolate cyclo-ligase n=1 Tax=Macrococcus brunensis TaxID=198483 RepID=A0A4R6BDQ0_9STAP|nr:5-formyltetrahydrofolate cyclo-ligase [Macrococcus brunensis]TDL97894.1 5-formyltetrahydrofolate cyclo-ligase [Macrococcus brunensis]ULG71101.1 5-formyltetrahydrofolate cyclo-ligase [Macrococcus brunensis]ULG73437.1 5-formyltetrahydrofolate cyclo-ligase [Macrococcus brunensis]